MKKVRRLALEAALENAEGIFDALVDNEFIGAIPVVGTAVKVSSAINSIRERAFAAKIEAFARDLDSLDPRLIKEWRQKVVDDPYEAEKVGETLLLTIDRLTELDKTNFISLLFISYIDGIVDSTTLFRLMVSIDQANAEDLYDVVREDENNFDEVGGWRQHLLTSGLTEVYMNNNRSIYYTTAYRVSPLGLKFRKAINHALKIRRGEQGGADQPATAPDSESESNEKPEPESEVRPQ